MDQNESYFFKIFENSIFEGNVATMLDIICLTVIVFSQLLSQIYNDYIENTQKGA